MVLSEFHQPAGLWVDLFPAHQCSGNWIRHPPYLFTYAFTAALVVLIYNHFEIQKTSVFWIPPMIILWINCHGGAVAGIAILGMVVVVESLRCKLKGLQLPSYLIISLVASGIALLINPYGHELLMF